MSRDRAPAPGGPESTSAEDRWENAFADAVRDAYAGDAPSEEFRLRMLARLRERASGAITGRQRRWLPALRLSMAAAALVTLLVVFAALQPRSVDAGLLDRVIEAMARFRTGHLVFMRVTEDGRLEYERQLWFREGSWRSELDGHTWIYTPEGTWSQHLPDRRWIRSNEKSNFGEDLRGLAPVLLGRKFQEWGRESRIRYLESRDGPPGSFQVVVEPKGEKERILLSIDRVTSVPYYFELQNLRNGEWRASHRTIIELGKPIPVELFRPIPPKSDR